MIEAKELRIGNYVANEKGKWEVAAIFNDGQVYVCDRVNKEVIPIEVGYALKPIPLTEEWLVRCGFKNKGPFEDSQDNSGYKDCDVYELSNHKATIYIDEGSFAYELAQESCMSYGPQIATCTVKHLHQLQNLYYTLTQTELEIKE